MANQIHFFQIPNPRFQAYQAMMLARDYHQDIFYSKLLDLWDNHQNDIPISMALIVNRPPLNLLK